MFSGGPVAAGDDRACADARARGAVPRRAGDGPRPGGRLFVWDRLRELRDSGVTLVLTTHDMDEAAALADRVGIMDHGKLLALDTPEALMRSVPERRRRSSSRPAHVTTDGRPDRRRPRRAARRSSWPSRSTAARRGRPAGRGGTNGELRVRLYVDGDAPLLVAPAAGVLDRARLDARRRQARHPDARGRLHPPHREDAADERARGRQRGAGPGAGRSSRSCAATST